MNPTNNEVNKSSEDVMPGETVSAAYGFTLNNKVNPLIINFLDENKTIIGTKEIRYSNELAKKSTDGEFIDTTNLDEQEVAEQTEAGTNWFNGRNWEQEAIDKFREAQSWGWSNEEAAAYADGRDLNENQQTKVVNSESEAVNLAITTYGDNNGDWTWGSMGEVDGGYFIKAISTEGLQTTMTGTAKSIVVHYDGTISEN